MRFFNPARLAKRICEANSPFNNKITDTTKGELCKKIYKLLALGNQKYINSEP